MSRRRIEMYQYRQVRARMRTGDFERDIARIPAVARNAGLCIWLHELLGLAKMAAEAPSG